MYPFQSSPATRHAVLWFKLPEHPAGVPHEEGSPQAAPGRPRYTGRVSPARRVLTYLRPYAARYGAGFACLALATGLSLGIPWQVQEAVDDLRAGGPTLCFPSAVIVRLSLLHRPATLRPRVPP